MPVATLTFVAGTLVLSGVSRSWGERLFVPVGGRWDARTGCWRCDAIHYAALAEPLRRSGLAWRDDVPQWPKARWSKSELPTLREEQRQAVEAWCRQPRGCVVMPTGTGKTEVALAAMERMATSTLVVAPVRDLMYQWHRRILDRLGYDAGVIGDSVFRVRPVSVTTYDSACIHVEKLGNRFGMVVFDECHHLPGPIRRDAALMSAAPYRLGLTATPERSDGREADLLVVCPD